MGSLKVCSAPVETPTKRDEVSQWKRALCGYTSEVNETPMLVANYSYVLLCGYTSEAS